MLDKLKRLFANTESETDEQDQLLIPSAAAILLFEVAWADHEISAAEVEHISTALNRLFTLTPKQVNEVIESARQEHQDSISMHSFTREINNSFTPEQKCSLVTAMWQLSLADQDIHKYEEHIIRKLADLIYVSHKDFIAAKLKAKKLLASD